MDKLDKLNILTHSSTNRWLKIHRVERNFYVPYIHIRIGIPRVGGGEGVLLENVWGF